MTKNLDYAVEAISEHEIRSRTAELGAAISADFEGRDPLFVVVMVGAIPFAADLVRTVTISAEIDFLGLNRFGESGRINIAMDLGTPVLDRHVIIVEDIIDTGLSLTALRRMMHDRGAASVSTAALTDKTRRRVTSVPIEYRGFEVGDEFLIGYGLDWQGLYRNLRSVWAVLDMEALIADPRVLLTDLRGSDHS
ncbi:MAG: phosphoribosyltransferase family protein [Actinobacteria bacterium]|nr:phosphoribosyltransferase family protein [Actinomycetota bacterium]